MHDTNTKHPSFPQDGLPEMFRPPVETPATILEARLEDAGRRISTYLRHLPVHERRRHELTLEALRRLAEDPGVNATEAEARGMKILRELLNTEPQPLFVLPALPVSRVHMKPEEMDRRPWVRVFLRAWQPLWSMMATIFNTSLIDFFLYALLLAGLYLLGTVLS
jgi:hypothetical protein